MRNTIDTIEQMTNDAGYNNLHDAKFEYNYSKGWSMNRAALDAINSVIIGVRDGWSMPVLMDENSGENEFLCALNLLEILFSPLGIFIEGGVFHKRKIWRNKNNRFHNGPIKMVRSKTNQIPTRLITGFRIFIGISRDFAVQLHDCYFENNGARYRIFDSGIMSSNHEQILKKMCDAAVIEASILGVPLTVIDHYVENNNMKLHQLPWGQPFGEFRPKSVESFPWKKYFFWDYDEDMEDPYNIEIDSPSRDAAIACMSRMNSNFIWTPKGWATC